MSDSQLKTGLVTQMLRHLSVKPWQGFSLAGLALARDSTVTRFSSATGYSGWRYTWYKREVLLGFRDRITLREPQAKTASLTGNEHLRRLQRF